MVYDRADGVITLCESKYQKKPVGLDIINEVDAKADALRAQFPKKTIQKVLIAVNGASKPLEDSRYFYRIIGRSTLVAMSRGCE